MPDAEALVESGRRLERAGVLDEALEAYQKARRLATRAETISLVFRRISHVQRTRCEWDAALEAARNSRRFARKARSRELEAEAINAEAAVHQVRGELKLAAKLYAEMLDLTVDPRICAVALQNLGSIAATEGDLQRAKSYFQHSRERFSEAAYPAGEAVALNNLGRVTLDSGDAASAVTILQEALSAARRLDDTHLSALAELNYGAALAEQGELSEAEECISAALGHFTLVENHWRRIECLRVLGDLTRLSAGVAEAELLYRKAADLASSIGAAVELELLQQRLKDLR